MPGHHPAHLNTRPEMTASHAPPARCGQSADWLPAPESGPFSLTVRIYAVLGGTYKLPPVKLREGR